MTRADIALILFHSAACVHRALASATTAALEEARSRSWEQASAFTRYKGRVGVAPAVQAPPAPSTSQLMTHVLHARPAMPGRGLPGPPRLTPFP
jgi:hypothetical protein